MQRPRAEEVSQIVGQNLRVRRLHRRLRQDDLAMHLPLTRGALSDIERGYRNVTAGELKAIADFFGTLIDELVDPDLIERFREAPLRDLEKAAGVY